MRVGLISLGCDKNTVDSERVLATLSGHGAEHVSDLSRADVILVNTCGFIDAAKQESIETLIQVGGLKEDGTCKAVVAVGCLVEQYREELEPSLPEVDLFVGLRDLGRLVPELQSRGLLSRSSTPHPGERVALTGRSHVRYLKISEGCDHGCAFCAIPLWRGKHRSFDADRLVAEAQRLEAQGAVEVNLVAQDLAHYGRELRDGTDLASLLRRLLDETGIPWYRLLYIYSAGLREPVIDLVATESRLVPYLDMPIQHASDSVLQRMRRPERQAKLREKISAPRCSSGFRGRRRTTSWTCCTSWRKWNSTGSGPSRSHRRRGPVRWTFETCSSRTAWVPIGWRNCSRCSARSARTGLPQRSDGPFLPWWTKRDPRPWRVRGARRTTWTASRRSRTEPG